MKQNIVDRIINTLGCSKDEAITLLQEDREIDKMSSLKEIDADLTEEQKQSSKKARQSDRKPSVYKFDSNRKKKENTGKQLLIEKLRESLEELEAEQIETIHPEREITFSLDNVKYKIVLSAPRG